MHVARQAWKPAPRSAISVDDKGVSSVQVTVDEAEGQLSRLIEAAPRGEEVVIARGRTPVVRLTLLPERGVIFGLLTDRVPASSAPDFLEPLPDDELASWEGDGDTGARGGA